MTPKPRILPAALAILALAGCTTPRKDSPPATSAPPAEPPSAAPEQSAASPATAPKPEPAAAKPAPAPKPKPPAGMLEVPGGEFVMGADGVGERDEQPAHRVSVDTFWLDQNLITNAEYRQCMQAGACEHYGTRSAVAMKLGPDSKFRGPTQPVVGVSHSDAEAYCAWRGKRLPSEAEWERAARGDDGRTLPWGNQPADPKRHGCFGGCIDGITKPVGSFPEGAGPYGHLDLVGNAWQWVADHYDPIAYQRPTASRGVPGSCEQILEAQDQLRRDGKQGYTGSNPIPRECEYVLRGGAFNYPAHKLRASNRVHHPGSWRLVVASFRCAMDPGPAPPAPQVSDAGAGSPTPAAPSAKP